MKKNVSVSQFISSVKTILESNLRVVEVWGEITNLSQSSQGHYYFNLADPNSMVSCALFKMDVLRNPIVTSLKEGDEVEIEGSLSVYAKRGTFQIIAKKIIKRGKGDLAAQFEMLKRKLTTEGLFDPSIKKAIPKFPKKIAIITAINGAALQDFLNVTLRRSFECHILIIPATMQGDSCAASVIKGLDYIDHHSEIDLVVIARGGGSSEDLWAFNDERLVRKIHQCRVPVISAIGHEVDYTLVDFVSDMRAETPTAAAEIITQKQMDLINQLKLSQQKLCNIMINWSYNLNKRLSLMTPIYLAKRLNQMIASFHRKLESLKVSDRLHELTGIYQAQQTLDDLMTRMQTGLKFKMQDQAQKLETLSSILRVTNPKQVLDRGYTYTTNESGEVIANTESFKKINKNESLKIYFKDGFGQVYKR